MGIDPSTTQRVNVTLYNGNSYPVSYNLTHETSPTVLSKTSSSIIFRSSMPFVYDFASIDFNTTDITIPAQSSRVIYIDITVPDSIATEYAPIFQGKIKVSGNNGESVAVPYIATVSDDFKVWTEDHEPKFVYDVNNGKYLTSESSSPSSNDTFIPTLNISSNAVFYSPLFVGCTQYYLAVVQTNYSSLTFPISAGKNGVAGVISGFPLSKYPRNPSGMYARISIPGIPTGQYRLLAAALPAIPNISANSSQVSDWQTFLSTPFNYVSTSTYSSSSSQVPATAQDAGTDLGGIVLSQATIRSANTNSTVNISPYDTLQVSIPYRALNGFKTGFKLNITLPSQLTGFPDTFNLYKRSGEAILQVSIDNSTNVLQATVLADPGQTMVTGYIVFGATLKNPEQYSGPTQVPFVFYSLNFPRYYVINMIEIAPIDPVFPSIVTRVLEDEVYNSNSSSPLLNVYADVYIPAQFRNWNDLKVDLSVPNCYFDCPLVRVLQTTNLNNLEMANNDTTLFMASSISCGQGSKSISISLTNPASSNRSLRISLPINLNSLRLTTVKMLPITGRVYGTFYGSEFSYELSQKFNNAGLVGYSNPMIGLDKL